MAVSVPDSVLTMYHLRKFVADLKKFMNQHNITQTELGIRMGKNPTSVNSVLNNSTNVNLKTLISMANAAGLDVTIEIKPRVK